MRKYITFSACTRDNVHSEMSLTGVCARLQRVRIRHIMRYHVYMCKRATVAYMHFCISARICKLTDALLSPIVLKRAVW